MKSNVFRLNENRHLEPSSIRRFFGSSTDDGPYWIDFLKPEPPALTELLSPLHLHPLVLEVCLDPASGSRVAPYEQALLIKLPTQLNRVSPDPSFLSIICLPRAVITIHESTLPTLEGLVTEFSSAVRFHAISTSAIVYQMLDRLIDQDMIFVLQARREIESLEEAIDHGSDTEPSEEILALKRRIARLSIAFEDQRHCIAALQTTESEVFDIMDFREYFRDSLANLEYGIRSAGRQQAHVSELQQHYQLKLQDRTNKRLRLLTILSAVFMPLTLIAGIYGMNFRSMPELRWPYAYPLVLVVMFLLASGLLWIFYRKGWFK